MVQWPHQNYTDNVICTSKDFGEHHSGRPASASQHRHKVRFLQRSTILRCSSAGVCCYTQWSCQLLPLPLHRCLCKGNPETFLWQTISCNNGAKAILDIGKALLALNQLRTGVTRQSYKLAFDADNTKQVCFISLCADLRDIEQIPRIQYMRLGSLIGPHSSGRLVYMSKMPGILCIWMSLGTELSGKDRNCPVIDFEALFTRARTICFVHCMTM